MIDSLEVMTWRFLGSDFLPLPPGGDFWRKKNYSSRFWISAMSVQNRVFHPGWFFVCVSAVAILETIPILNDIKWSLFYRLRQQCRTSSWLTKSRWISSFFFLLLLSLRVIEKFENGSHDSFWLTLVAFGAIWNSRRKQKLDLLCRCLFMWTDMIWRDL